MSQLFCAQEKPREDVQQVSNPLACNAELTTKSNADVELQCGPAHSLSATDAAALFGHYSDAEAQVASDAHSQASRVESIFLNASQVRENARTLRDSLHRFSTDYDAIIRILNQHPEMVRAVRESYDAEFSITGKGLVADLKRTLPDTQAELATALLTRAGIATAQKPPVYIKQPQNGQPHAHHAIVASPAIKVAVPGTEIRYSVAKEAELHAEGSHYTYEWLCLNDPQTSKSRGLPAMIAGPSNRPSWSARWDFPGNHKILCRVQLHVKQPGLFGSETGERPEFIEYQQTVHEQGDVLARAIDKLPRRESPESQLHLLQAYKEALHRAELQPRSEKLDAKTKDALDAQLTKLGQRLKSSEGHTRYPVKAVHVAAESAQVSPLQVFVSRIAQANGLETWALVDITNPADRRLTGEYVGSGKDARQALKSAIAAWDSGNRYPKGRLRLQIPVETGANLDQEFQTDGMSFWDSIAEFLNQVGLGAGLGMLGAAVAATLAPDPTVSKVAAVLLWTSILSGTAGASINLIQRHAEHMATLHEDAQDTLTIVGNILGARWAVGATVKGLSLAGSRMGTAIAIGRFSTDAAQGILLSVEYVAEYQQILTDPDPKTRTDKLIKLLGKAALSGGLLILSLRGSKSDLEELNTQQAKLSKLSHPGETIELGKTAIADHAATTEPKLAPAEAAPKTRVTDPVPGLYDSIDATENVAPDGWKFEDKVTHLYGATRIYTEIVGPNKETGKIMRTYDAKTQTLQMEIAFLDKLPNKIMAGVPLTPEGTSLVSYLTLRQMKLAKVHFASLKSIRMDHIQNIESLLQLHQLTREKGLSFDEAVAQTKSVQYATTSIQQSGHTIVGVRLEITNECIRWPINTLLEHYETDQKTFAQLPERVAKHEALLAQYNVKRSDIVLANYNIHIDLAPHPNNSN